MTGKAQQIKKKIQTNTHTHTHGDRFIFVSLVSFDARVHLYNEGKRGRNNTVECVIVIVIVIITVIAPPYHIYISLSSFISPAGMHVQCKVRD